MTQQTDALSSAPAREAAFDVYKGIAILAVLLHHVTGIGVRTTVRGSQSHLAAVMVNRFLLFCVPVFLFLMIFLLARSLLRRPMTPAESWRKRIPRILVPYLIWTVFYAFYNAYSGFTSPASLGDPARWQFWLLWGKASYHLYFMVIALQLYVIVPGLLRPLGTKWSASQQTWASVVALALALFAFPNAHQGGSAPEIFKTLGGVQIALALGAFYVLTHRLCFSMMCAPAGEAHPSKRATPAFQPAAWFALAYGLQIAAYGIHKVAIRSAYPATLALWYLNLVVLGIWAVRNYDAFRASWPRLKGPLGLLCLILFAAFFPVALRMTDRQPVNPFTYVAFYWLYTGMAALFLLGLSLDVAARLPKLSAGLAFLGSYSMELYLLHPALLSQVTRAPFHGSTLLLAAYEIVVFLGLTAATLALAVGLRKIGAGRILFGR
jgi:peptidoglycan/LPS O-acetylase OafA/YrhL